MISVRALSIALLATASTQLLPAQSTLRWYTGTTSGNRLGTSVSGGKDVDGDGVPDVAAGAIIDFGSALMAGRVRVFSGATGSVIYTFVGGSSLDFFGNSVALIGDANGDGRADVLVGAPYEDPNGASSGSATLYSGVDGSVLYTFDGAMANDQFGFAVGAAGDVNADGYDDLICGAWLYDGAGPDSGRARVFSGADGSLLYTVEGDAAGDNFGRAVDGAGDVDGDGYDDFVVGAYRDDDNGADSGSARVFSGATGLELFTLFGNGAGDHFGFSVAGAGDVNKDGLADVVIGALDDDDNGTDSGSARVHAGGGGALLYEFFGDSGLDQFGYSVDGAGDVNGDGYADVIIGILREDANGGDSGSAVVRSGFDGSVLSSFDGSSVADRLGWAVSTAGDANGDGFADYVVTARYDDPNSRPDSGSVYVVDAGFAGTPPGVALTGIGCPGTGGRLPRIGVRGVPLIGDTPRITLRGGPVNSPGTAIFIGDPTLVPLVPLGMAGCTLYCSPVASLVVGTDANGMAGLDVPITNDPGSIGASLQFQWVMPDPGAPYTLPLTLSDGLRLTIGG